MHRRKLHGSPLRRRDFLAEAGLGFGSLAAAAILAGDGILRPNTAIAADAVPGAANLRLAHKQPKAKSVIWIFLVGGLSHMESFDPKPALNEFAGKTIAETPYAATLESPYLKKNLREIIEGNHGVMPKVYPMQIGYQPRGESGIAISDWWPNLSTCVDDLAVVRSMWTTDNDHGAQLQFHTGRHMLEGQFPTIGSWIHYGLGTLNENLPQYVVLGTPIADCCGGIGAHGANYLGPEHAGVQLEINPAAPLPFATPGPDIYREEQAAEFELLRRMHQLAERSRPDDSSLRARIRSYELAFRMQTAVPEIVDFSAETADTQSRYGFEKPQTATFAKQCLAARRLVERGVRFVQLFHGSNGGAGAWDAHGNLKAGHSELCGQVDQPIAALIQDLKQRGLLDETIVVLATEFGRTPGAQNSDGRDHHPYGFSIVMAGGGLRGGIAHGKTDELGFHAVEDRHYVTDVHATVLQQLGLDPHRLEIPGRKRLEIDYGHAISAIIA